MGGLEPKEKPRRLSGVFRAVVANVNLLVLCGLPFSLEVEGSVDMIHSSEIVVRGLVALGIHRASKKKRNQLMGFAVARSLSVLAILR